MPRLSIITINYNNAAGLQKTMQSVINQAFSDFEYIVIDGDSTDGSKDIIFKNKVKLTHGISEKDSGIYNAMNKGIKLAKGEYVLFLNSGDYLENSETIHSIIDLLTVYDIIYGNMIIDRNGQFESVKSPSELSFEEMIRGTLWHPVSFIKRELFLKYGLYNESYKIISDYDFFLKTIFIERVSIKHIDTIISVFNTDGIGSSESNKDLHNNEKREVQEKYFHPEVINSALRFSDLKRTKPQIIYSFIKTRPLLLKMSKLVYFIAKRFF